MKLGFFLLLSTVLMTTIKAWWENGHMLTAQIAEIVLKESHPEIYQVANDMVTSMKNLDYDIDDTFVTSACWPDDIKDKAMNFWESWHFYGRPVNPKGEYLMQDELQSTSNAINALERAVLELNDRDGTDITMQKAIFIRFIIHIVGDVHQPLHSANMFNQTFNGPNGDMGGNIEQITDIEGATMNLHAFWDQGAEYFQKSGANWIKRPLNESSTILMEDWGKELMEEYPQSFFGKLVNELNPEEWTRESWEYASNSSYPLIYKQSQLTVEYQDRAVEICKKRVTLAGYRLANFLIEFLDIYTKQENKIKYEQKSHQDKHSGFEVDKRQQFTMDEVTKQINQFEKMRKKEQSKSNLRG